MLAVTRQRLRYLLRNWLNIFIARILSALRTIFPPRAWSFSWV